jgi:hypothetical protein
MEKQLVEALKMKLEDELVFMNDMLFSEKITLENTQNMIYEIDKRIKFIKQQLSEL